MAGDSPGEGRSFLVIEARREDVGRGIARLDPKALKEMGAAPGDVLELVGTGRTVAKAMPNFKEARGQQAIQLDGITRANAGLALGGKASVAKVAHSSARRVVMAPLGPGHLREDDLDYIARRLDGLAMRAGDRVRTPLFAGGHREFRVAKSEPDGAVIVHPSTLLAFEAAEGGEESEVGDIVTYDDLGGMRREIAKIREMVELPLSHPEVFDRLGIAPPKGVLLYGPPGCGKTLLGRAVAHESEASFLYVSGPEIIQKYYGESESRLRTIFEEARGRAPSIVFFDEIDSLAPKRESVEGEVEKRVVAQLLSLMDGLKSRGEVVVMAATNRPNSIDPALRRPGRFDREIVIGIPNAAARREILEIHARGMPLARDVDLGQLAATTHGFTGADLNALCREAAMAALRRTLPQLSKPMAHEALMAMEVGMRDFKSALSEVEPSALRDVAVEVPQVSWEEIAGLEGIKKALDEAVAWPLREPALFAALGLEPPRGILLYGPPGNGKTLLAKALASQSNLNFLSVKGPELLSKYLGESERAVRELFARARQAAPAIVFLDEIDALVPARGSTDRSPVTDRVVSQLLTELDGIEALKEVFVVAATNRADLLDEALLRPGRLEYRLEVGKPDRAARKAVLKVHLKKRPLAQDIDLESFAAQTDGASAAQIRFLCDEAARSALRRAFAAAAGTRDWSSLKIEKSDFDSALASLGIEEAAKKSPAALAAMRPRSPRYGW